MTWHTICNRLKGTIIHTICILYLVKWFRYFPNLHLVKSLEIYCVWERLIHHEAIVLRNYSNSTQKHRWIVGELIEGVSFYKHNRQLFEAVVQKLYWFTLHQSRKLATQNSSKYWCRTSCHFIWRTIYKLELSILMLCLLHWFMRIIC